jgi:fructose-1-phosphate kinase PfkB-like protein
VVEGKSFRWSGKYVGDMNVAETLDTQLNVLDGYQPRVPASYLDSRYVFLANSPPGLQSLVLDQVQDSPFVVMDTMNLWIDTSWDDLMEMLQRVDMLIINDQEARSITKEHSLITAGRKLLDYGPDVVMVKKGEHGAFLWSHDFFYAIPAYPLEQVVDPTGAGASFAGGVMGYLAHAGDVTEEHLKRAMIYGSVVASHNVEDFSLNRFRTITRHDVDVRYQEFLGFTAHP